VYGAVFAWPAFLRSWLTATLTWGVLPVGAVAILMTHGLTGGAWGKHSRPVWLALAATMPLFIAAMLPLLFGLDQLFSWTQPAIQLPEDVQHKLGYLNEPFFIARNAIYFTFWLGLTGLLGVWQKRSWPIYAPGLILWVFAVTFFAVDWLMSLEPLFYSDVFGLMMISGTAASSFAFGLLLVVANMEPAIRKDLANLWLSVLLGWVFMMFAQLIIIWSGNIPHEIIWYVHRYKYPWPIINWAAFALYLVVPFAILLSTAAKRTRKWLTIATVLSLIGHLLFVQWLVLPAFKDWLPAQTWLDPAALIALGAGFVWIVGKRLERQEASHGEV
ncbi:MAG TPA: hypothetical protein VFL97_01860, partial [Nitrococcus sp.]|nr:hypothetical protein [Nitrococcus sp.]